MRAVVITAPGGTDVLEAVDLPARAPGPGEVRIAVRAAAVNPTDSVTRKNGVKDIPPPWIPGMDLAGVVESLGEGVDRLTVGEAVMAVVNARRPGGGAQAELVVVPAGSVVPLPDGIGFRQASTLPMTGLTARLGIDAIGLEAGQTLALSGGAGLLASYAIPMARELGWNVIADAHPDDEELVLASGCDAIVPRTEDFASAVRAAAPDGVDGLLDTAGLGAAATGAVRDGGAMVSVLGWTPDEPVRGIEFTAISVLNALERTDWLEELRRLASSGHLKVRPTVDYPPERADQAQRSMDAGGLRSRAVIIF